MIAKRRCTELPISWCGGKRRVSSIGNGSSDTMRATVQAGPPPEADVADGRDLARP
jgi:hypothetical protein